MFNRILAAAIMMTVVAAPQLSTAAQTDPNCADNVQELSRVEGGLEAIRKQTGQRNISLQTQFIQTQADGGKADGDFRVYIARDQTLRIDSNLGDFPTVLCKVKSGIEAHIFLSGLQAMAAGSDHVILTLKGSKDAKGLVEMTDNLPDKKGDAPKAFFKPVF